MFLETITDSIQNSVYCISYTADGHNINLNHPMPFQIRYLNNSIILSTYSSGNYLYLIL